MPTSIAHLVESLRRRFPALQRRVAGKAAVFLDGPAGTQVPQSVIEAISDYLRLRNANHGGCFATSRESDALLAEVHQAAAEFVGSDDADTVCFGPNMTTLTFQFSRAVARTWRPGDEVIVTRLDHDANIRPWVLAAEDVGAQVRWVDIRREDCTLDLEQFEQALNERTRLVAVGLASNAVGTINPVGEIVRQAHAVGAEVYVDAVHWAPHRLTDVGRLECDYLACSVYKFFGPHIGVLWGRRERMERLPAYKLEPVPDRIPDRWMTGTQNHEGLAGVLAAIEYLAEIGRSVENSPQLARRAALQSAYSAIAAYESELCWRLIEGLEQIPEVRIWGITERERSAERLPTVAWTHSQMTSRQIAERLAESGIFSWHGNYYAVELTTALGLEPDGMLRMGIAHYNTVEEIDRVIEEVASW